MTLPSWVDAEHERIGALFRAARAVQAPPPPELAVLQPRRRVVLSPRLAVLVMVASLLALASVAGVVARASQRPPPPPAPSLPRVQAAVAPQPPREEPTPVTPAPVPAVVRAPRRQAVAVLPPAPPPIEVPRSTLGEEAKVIATALGALRAGRPVETIEVLAQHRERFPQGALLPEAVVAEARAERALHHGGAALAALERLDAVAAAKHPELLVMRGELLAEQGDCAAAVRVLDDVLVEPPSPVLAERAQFARAKCAVALSEPTARQQLETYLRAWPAGAFVEEALGLLEVTP
jgi:hypothetical protein